MSDFPDLSRKTTNSLDTDFKAEVVAASLIEQGSKPRFRNHHPKRHSTQRNP